jgi:hypothetical protein
MEVTLDRSPIKLPRLVDDDASIPETLTRAHRALGVLTSEACAKVEAIRKDPTISESERRRQLSEVCLSFVLEAERIGEATASVASLASEAERSALNKSVARFDGARLLAIAEAVAKRPKSERMAAIIRAANTPDPEAAAALLTCPNEIGALADIDPRIVGMLRVALIDREVLTAVRNTEFATARMRVGLQATVAKVRELTGVKETPAERYWRGA